MLNKLPLLIVPTMIASVAALALAAPKPVPPPKPQAAPLVPLLQPYRAKPGGIQSVMPNMTQMPNAHIYSAFDVIVPGKRLLMDTSGRVIGQTENGGLHGVDHFSSRPSPAVPKPKH